MTPRARPSRRSPAPPACGLLAGLLVGGSLVAASPWRGLEPALALLATWVLAGGALGVMLAIAGVLARILATAFARLFVSPRSPASPRAKRWILAVLLTASAGPLLLATAELPSIARRVESRELRWVFAAAGGLLAARLAAGVLLSRRREDGPRPSVGDGRKRLAKAAAGVLVLGTTAIASAQAARVTIAPVLEIHLALAAALLGAGTLGARLLPRCRSLGLAALAVALASAAWIVPHPERLLEAEGGPSIAGAIGTFVHGNAPELHIPEAARARIPELFGRARSGFGDELDRMAAGRRRSNVLWITLCTVRRDRVGAFGGASGLTPNIDALAAESFVFERAYTTFPASSYALWSQFSGLYPSATPLFRRKAGRPLPREVAWLPEQVRSAGHATWALTALGATMLAGDFGEILRGFDIQNPYPHVESPRGAVIAEAFERILAGHPRERPFFAWVHLMDAHAPYEGDPPELAGPDARVRYDGDVRVADRAVGRILEILGDRKDRTIIVLHADHGEELGDHGGRFHYTSAYEEQVAIPLLLRVPGLPAGRSAVPVDLTDLAPTVGELLDLPPPARQHGDSLVPVLLGKPFSSLAHAELVVPHVPVSDRLMLVDGAGMKLILRGAWRSPELFDLHADPGERQNLAGSGHPVESELTNVVAALAAWIDGSVPTHAPGSDPIPPARQADEVYRRVARSVLEDPDSAPEDLVRVLDAVSPGASGEEIALAAALMAHAVPEVQAAAARALQRTAAREHAERLVPLLRAPAPSVRLAAAEALGSLGSAATVTALTEATPPTDEEALVFAVARGKLGDPEGLRELAGRLEDLAPALRDRVLVELARLGDADAADVLRAVVTVADRRSPTALAALGPLIAWGEAPACRILEQLVIERAVPPPLLVTALRALPAREPATWPPLLASTLDPDPGTRRAAVRRLASAIPISRIPELAEAYGALRDARAPSSRGLEQELARARRVLEDAGLSLDDPPAPVPIPFEELVASGFEVDQLDLPYPSALGSLPLPLRGRVVAGRPLSGSLVLVAGASRGDEPPSRCGSTQLVGDHQSSLSFRLPIPATAEIQQADRLQVGVATSSGAVRWLEPALDLRRR